MSPKNRKRGRPPKGKIITDKYRALNGYKTRAEMRELARNYKAERIVRELKNAKLSQAEFEYRQQILDEKNGDVR